MQFKRFLSGLLTLTLVLSFLPLGQLSVRAATNVFVNEIHYDNDGTDTDEGIEVAGPAGTDLGGWNLVLYNGNGGAVYNTVALSGTIPDQQNGFGTRFFAISGVQNGSPDGIALVDPGDNVVQFLSYEGDFTATDGPANGMTSTDIGVSEASNTPIGQSLQLTGSGTTYEDFGWSGPIESTYDAVNAGQTFSGGGGDDPPFVASTNPADGETDVSLDANVEVNFSEPVTVSGTWYDITCTVSGGHSATVSGGPQSFTLDPETDFVLDDVCTVTVFASQVTDQDGAPDNMSADYDWTFYALASQSETSVFVNEIHYDNAGTDTDEGIEVAGPAGTDLSGWSLVLYNGSNGAVYDTEDLGGTIPNQQNGFGTRFFAIAGVQNGSPDGVALVDPGDNAVQFLSYEGTFTAADGPASGMTSVDIGVEEPSDTPIGQSLQLTGSGTVYEDFTWSGPIENTYDAVNTGQTFTTGGDDPPSVSSTDPGDGETDVLLDADILITFSEPVTMTGDWYDITCTLSGPHTATESGGPQSFTLNPEADFVTDDVCIVTVFASQVTDQDGDPDNMTADYGWTFYAVASQPAVTVVINEIHADPAPDSPGDANGDGIRDTEDDEFVELVNHTDADLDVSGWTLSDGVDVRHTMPAGSVIPTGCSIVIFGGGTPTGSFGNSLVQTASSGALGLNNGGDTITLNDGSQDVAAYTYGSEGGDDQSLTRDPDITGPDPLIRHSTATGSNGALFSPGTRIDGTSFAGCPQTVAIYDVQGAGHRSPLAGQTVTVPGVVTALAYNGFYIQDATGDGDIATSDGIFVYTGSSPSVAVGDDVLVDATVTEYYPGGYGTGNLSTTELSNATITVVSSGNPLPAPTVIGAGGRVPPSQVIDDDATGDVETSGSFDAADDGIDFYESLEGMQVQVNDAIVVGPTNDYGEIAVVGDGGADAGLLTPRGGILAQPDDFNPERIILDDVLTTTPVVNVGDSFAGPIVGVMDYSFGNFKLLVTEPVPTTSGGLSRETTAAAGPDRLSVASFNVENLDPSDDAAKFADLASQIVNNLHAPDIIALQEIQDNSGPTNDGVVEADQTYNTLIAAIQDASGPLYEFREIAPEDLQDGGQPGANIRVGFMFRPDRVTFVDRPGAGPNTATDVVLGPTGVELSYSPGRIDPTHSAFLDSRKSLAGEFLFNEHKVFIIANHFNSKGDDDLLFGRVQPPVRYSENQRHQIAQVINDFVDDVLALDPNANVIVLGDLNDFQFSTTLDILAGDVLTNLVETLPLEEQYTYIFDGNSQVLDNLLISHNLLDNAEPSFDVVHGNAELANANRHTDHDPLVSTLYLPQPVLPLEQVQLDLMQIRWHPSGDGQAQFALVGEFQLPVGYTRDDLSGDLALSLTIAGVTGLDDLTFTRQDQLWYYEAQDEVYEGIKIEMAAIYWTADGAFIAARGELDLPGVNQHTRPAEATVGMRFAVATPGLANELVGEMFASFWVYGNRWSYFGE